MKHMHILKKDGKTWDVDRKPHQEGLVDNAASKRRAFKQKYPLYCLANLTPSPPPSPIPPSPIPSPPPADEPTAPIPEEPPIAEELPIEEPAVASVPRASGDSAEWRERVSSDIADLRSGLTRLEDFVREADMRARQESEWLRTTLLSMIRGTTAPVAPELSAPRAASPLPTTPASRAGEAGTPVRDSSIRVDSPLLTGATVERVGDSARDISPGGDEATS